MLNIPIAERTAINNIISLAKTRKDILAVILYGSYATGHVRSDSDVDIVVITEKSNFKEINKYVAGKIDLHCFSELPVNIQHSIFFEGVELYVKDLDQLKQIKSDTFRQYCDYEWYFNNAESVIFDQTRAKNC